MANASLRLRGGLTAVLVDPTHVFTRGISWLAGVGVSDLETWPAPSPHSPYSSSRSCRYRRTFPRRSGIKQVEGGNPARCIRAPPSISAGDLDSIFPVHGTWSACLGLGDRRSGERPTFLFTVVACRPLSLPTDQSCSQPSAPCVAGLGSPRSADDSLACGPIRSVCSPTCPRRDVGTLR